jgi:hypothetical protein
LLQFASKRIAQTFDGHAAVDALHHARVAVAQQRCPEATWCWRKSLSPVAITGSIGVRCTVALDPEVLSNADFPGLL